MKIETTNSGFVISAIKNLAKNTINASYTKKGELVSAEYLFKNNTSAKVGKAHTSVLNALRELGKEQAILLSQKPQATQKPVKKSGLSVADMFKKLIAANSKEFKPAPLTTVKLASGKVLHMETCNKKGHIRVKNGNDEGYATTLENAYKNLEYQAKLNHNHKKPESFGRSLDIEEYNFFNGLMVA